MRILLLLTGLGLCCLTVSGGCGGPDTSGRLKVYKVTGTISIHGAPLSDATVTFSPMAGDGRTAYGRSDSSGSYTLTTYDPLDGAAEGNYAVLVSKYVAPPADEVAEEAGHSDDPNANFDPAGHSAGAAAAPSVVSPKYASKTTSPLRAVVSPDGENVFDFQVD